MKSILKTGAIGLVLLGAGAWAGATITPARVAQGEVRPVAPPASFQSGGQLSVPILREIAATLVQIDSRLARLERAALAPHTAESAAPSARRPSSGRARTD
jgi:hypothetical protein